MTREISKEQFNPYNSTLGKALVKFKSKACRAGKVEPTVTTSISFLNQKQ